MSQFTGRHFFFGPGKVLDYRDAHENEPYRPLGYIWYEALGGIARPEARANLVIIGYTS